MKKKHTNTHTHTHIHTPKSHKSHQQTDATARTTSAKAAQPAKPGRPWLEYGPLVLFFIANWYAGILWGTAILLLATLISLGISWHLDRYIPKFALVGAVAIGFFGGLTLIFADDLFIKIKPTIISGLLACVLVGGQLIGRNPLKMLLGGKLALSQKGWQQMTWIWACMFCISAIANEIAWRTLSTDSWVTFKVFGLTAISFVFALFTVPIIHKQGTIRSAGDGTQADKGR